MERRTGEVESLGVGLREFFEAVAAQLRDVPDGGEIVFRVVD